MNAEIFAALRQLEKERGIPVDYMVEKITQALVAAYKKDRDGYTDNVYVELTEDAMRMYAQKEVVKSVGNKSGNKIFIIQAIDRKMDFEDIARAKDLDFDELLTEIEGIVNSGTKLDISYYIEQVIDEDKSNDIYLYFKEDAQSDSLDEAIEELGGDYTEEEIRLVRIKFMCEQGN